MPLMRGEKHIWYAKTVLAVLMPVMTLAAEENDIQYTFTQTDSSYSFYGSFKINANPECILDISFNFRHIRALAPDAEEVILVDSDSNWNQISYIYQKFIFFENTTIWSRKLDEEKQRVDFTLVSSQNNQTMMPRLISSSGFYQVKQQSDYIIVEYYQECKLAEESITKFYLNRIKKEAINFMDKFSEYASEYCNRSSPEK